MIKLRTACVAIAMTVIPLIARADEDDQLVLSDKTLQWQRSALILVGSLVLGGILIYLIRRWQTIKSGNVVDGSWRDD